MLNTVVLRYTSDDCYWLLRDLLLIHLKWSILDAPGSLREGLRCEHDFIGIDDVVALEDDVLQLAFRLLSFFSRFLHLIGIHNLCHLYSLFPNLMLLVEC